jgi:hypothetical protein
MLSTLVGTCSTKPSEVGLLNSLPEPVRGIGTVFLSSALTV